MAPAHAPAADPDRRVVSIRQILGHRDVPEFVGDIDGEAPYRAEPLPGIRVVAEPAPVERG